MVSAISHSMISWTQMAILEPTDQGIARINRCFRGVNLHNINHTKLDWSERVVDLLTGLALMIPLLNMVVWVFMKTFGNTEMLSLPTQKASDEVWEAAQTEAAIPIVARTEPLTPIEEEIPIGEPARFKTLDHKKDGPVVEASWEVKTFEDSYISTRKSRVDTSTARYNSEWELQELEYNNPTVDWSFKFVKTRNIVTASEIKQGKSTTKTFVLEDTSLPWIQQADGVRPFVLSRKTQMDCYGINPEDWTLTKLTVAKKSKKILNDYPNRGEAVRLDTWVKDGWRSHFTFADSWHDQKTGQHLKSSYGFKAVGIWGSSSLSE